MDLISHALELKTQTIAPCIIEDLVPLLLHTADLVAIPRFNVKSPEPYDKDIDVSACLSLLHLAALGCVSEEESMTRFWELMRWEFVLMMLSQNQPTEHYEMMLSILSTSVLRNSFGPIDTNSDTNVPNNQIAGYIIERLTWPLYEIPYLPMSPERVSAATLSHLRLRIIELLIHMTFSAHAGRALATHPKAIGRLVSFLSEELDTLYQHNHRHKESAHLITLAARLLYHLVIKHEDEVDVSAKLATIRGGTQKYLLMLARLNFSEDDLVLERHVGSDVKQYALELLDLAITPEEAETVEQAFVGG